MLSSIYILVYWLLTDFTYLLIFTKGVLYLQFFSNIYLFKDLCINSCVYGCSTNPTLVVENGLPTNLGVYSDTLVVRNGLPTKLGVYSDEYNVVFPTTTVGGKSMCRVQIFNPDKATALVSICVWFYNFSLVLVLLVVLII